MTPSDMPRPAHRALESRTVLIVDDHQLVGSSLEHGLRAEDEDAHYHPTGSARAVLETAARYRPGLVVLDLDLGRDEDGRRIDGVELIPALRRAGWRVLVLSSSSNAARIGSALAAGGYVWISKNAPFPQLLLAVREARAGRSVLSGDQRERLIGLHRKHERDQHELTVKLARLTPREHEVLAQLAEGKRAQAIASHFVVSVPTVRTQVRAVLGKLEVGSQLEAVALFRGTARHSVTQHSASRH
ncbi:DNA-binding NarL/FixJ family response regulator [Pseudonocardia sediminis]|uniref:DNA-binding NarL/FixJ family response regulator n=1 Tax=Pseudonocardia sediminis TaxID=1397368 RepID=A0A4Q7V2G6_PSEST|nr:response regulator transcription factor [Pseudonocardia sediminis]RZT86769.1 DNA-binding NarL/FixJ family response regulator [Pseudonocardia sediminis]